MKSIRSEEKNNQLEQKAKEKLAKLSKNEIKACANHHRRKKRNANIATFLFVLALSVVVCTVSILNLSNKPILSWATIAILLLFTAGSAIECIKQNSSLKQKTDEDILLSAFKNEISVSHQATKQSAPNDIQKQNNFNAHPNFVVSKTIPIQNNGLVTQQILIDNLHKKFIYQNGKKQTKPYLFSDIMSYEVYENEKSEVKGSIGSALIGGAFLGLGGAIIGGSAGREINQNVTQLKLIIRVADFDSPLIEVNYIKHLPYEKNSRIYKKMISNIQLICSQLEYMMNEKTLEQSTNQTKNASEEKSSKEQLQELKELLDDGLITQEDYEQKKKQILGL